MISKWSKVNGSMVSNCYRKCGVVQAEQNDLEEESNQLLFAVNAWDLLAGAFGSDN